MTAEIHWEFAALREKQIQDQIARETADVIAFALEGAPQSSYPTIPYGGDADLIFYCSPSKVELPSDSEPA